ncbi:transcription termination factor 2-like [Daphnia carinata]|uniref:transcription termination factor 2-like n=1 Tax=Daphnia carinata TaxID=120202 RepID=UPI00257992FB|nr:transcription termination factor 2-like [Daphnia carinata]
MSRYSYRANRSDLVPSTPDEENSGDEASDYEVSETPIDDSLRQPKSNTSSLEETDVIEESLQEYSSEPEQPQHSNSFETSEHEKSWESEDQLDRSGISNKEHLSASKFNSNSMKDQQVKHRSSRSSDEDSNDDSEANVSYRLKGISPVPGMEYASQPDPDDTYQVIQAGKRHGHMVIRSSEENSAEASDAEDVAVQKSNLSDRSVSSLYSLDDSSPYPTTKKNAFRNPVDSDSDSSFDASRVKKPTITSDESDSSVEPTPRVRHTRSLGKRVVKRIESDDSDEDSSPRITPHNRYEGPNKADNHVSSSNGRFPSTRMVSPKPSLHSTSSTSPHLSQSLIQEAPLATSFDKYDSGNGSTMERHNENGSRKSSTAIENKSQRPDPLEEDAEIPIEDLSNSILEVSSTVVSFSSPEVLDNSIEEITSASEISLPIPPVTLSAAEAVRLREDLERKKLLMKSCRLESLPDGGAKLKEQIRLITEKLESAAVVPDIRPAPVVSSASDSEVQEDELRKQLQMKKWAMGNASAGQKERLRIEIGDMERRLIQLSIANATNAGATSKSKFVDFQSEMSSRTLGEKQKGIQLLPEAPRLTEMQKKMFADNAGKELYQKTETGYISAAARREAVSITMDSLENLHRSLASCPKETEKEPTPSCLTVPLLPHQERALKWLLWRETQVPAGGILADDMGLGKTLTMISLVVRQKELDPAPPASSDIWLSKTVKIKRSAGTLVVCPASVVGQWEKEIQRRCKRNSLSVVIFHGPDRNKLAPKLHHYDVVITTYQIVSREIANVKIDKKDGDSKPIGDFDVETDASAIRQSVLLQIAFDRIILDEAHVIRNPKAGISQAVCRLRAVRRWAVSGTPVQNKELDMYSLLRFLRVSPFDQLAVWKRWVDSSKAKNEQAQGRLQLLIKALLLRRTKDQKAEGSETPLVAMPSREVHVHQVQLSKEENEVYQKLLAFSRKALEEYIKGQEARMREGFTYDRTNLPELPQKNVTKQMMLVLLLRLRQACSHPALIQTMLDATETESMGSEEAKIEDNDMDLISQMSNMTLGSKPDEPKKEEENFFTHTNPIFDRENLSSKMKYIIDEVKKIVAQDQKAVVVSQWTSMLELFAQHFRKLRIRCHLIAGSVAIKHRTEIVEDFNGNPKGSPVILLSLSAGGVGLNLVGGNHIFLADMHWNPQLEAQACDRVYRVGQTKDVHVHRMVTQGTVEERILQLQQQKLAMANGILTGAAKLATKGLTIDDLKMLFNPGPPPYAPKPMLNPDGF